MVDVLRRRLEQTPGVAIRCNQISRTDLPALEEVRDAVGLGAGRLDLEALAHQLARERLGDAGCHECVHGSLELAVVSKRGADVVFGARNLCVHRLSIHKAPIGLRVLGQSHGERVVAHHPHLRVLDDEAAAGHVGIGNQEVRLDHVAVDSDRLLLHARERPHVFAATNCTHGFKHEFAGIAELAEEFDRLPTLHRRVARLAIAPAPDRYANAVSRLPRPPEEREKKRDAGERTVVGEA